MILSLQAPNGEKILIDNIRNVKYQYRVTDLDRELTLDGRIDFVFNSIKDKFIYRWYMDDLNGSITKSHAGKLIYDFYIIDMYHKEDIWSDTEVKTYLVGAEYGIFILNDNGKTIQRIN